MDVKDSVHVAAVDLGASGGRVIVGSFEPEHGLQLEVVHRFENGAIEVDGSLRWDVQRLVSEVRHGLRIAIERYPIASVGIDTWGVDYGIVDTSGALVTQPHSYRDSRTAGMAERLEKEGRLSDVFRATGTQNMDINTLFQLKAEIASDPSLVEGDLKVVMMPDLIAHLLGAESFTDPSMASTTQLYDIRGREWSQDLAREAGVPESWLPKVRREGTVAGSVRIDGREIPCIRVCGHDTASAVASIDVASNEMFVSCGTWSLAGKVLQGPVLTDEARDTGVSNELGAEGSVLLLQNCTGLWIAQELRRGLIESGHRYSWDEIAAMASSAPRCGTVIDTEAPLFAVPGRMAERIRSFARATDQVEPSGVGELFRCVYESLALRYRLAADDLARVCGHPVERVRLVGGGAQNDVICQSVASTLGVPVLSGPVEATAIGNVLVQFVGLGVFENLSQARDLVGSIARPRLFRPEDEMLNGRFDWYKREIVGKGALC